MSEDLFLLSLFLLSLNDTDACVFVPPTIKVAVHVDLRVHSRLRMIHLEQLVLPAQRPLDLGKGLSTIRTWSVTRTPRSA